MNTEFHTAFEWFYVDAYKKKKKTWMEETYDIPNKNP